MNRVTLIGNLTADPETATTKNGKSVCRFTVAVNRRGTNDADYFNISAWNGLGDICKQYLSKGRKVAVNGSISAHAYKRQNGDAVAQMDVIADDVEFLTPKGETSQQAQETPKNDGFVKVEDEPLPWES